MTPAAFCCLLLCSAQDADSDRIWRDFLEWARTQTGSLSIPAYRERLIEGGLSAQEAERRVALIPRLYAQDPLHRAQMNALTFDKIYRDPAQTSFSTKPSAFLVSSIARLKPGTALDVATGQGRNGLYLASKGWNVTGFDISEEGLKSASERAAKSGLRIATSVARIEDFNYGTGRWDLICLIYVDAPFVDPAFVARIRTALKPGGVVVIDEPFRSPVNPEQGHPETEQDKPNALPNAWTGFEILTYEDAAGIADWQQTAEPRTQYQARIVHMLARKK
jgi:SAM-dependent methyltransferase